MRELELSTHIFMGWMLMGTMIWGELAALPWRMIAVPLRHNVTHERRDFGHEHSN